MGGRADDGSRPATEPGFKRVLRYGRSSMAEPWAVNPLVPRFDSGRSPRSHDALKGGGQEYAPVCMRETMLETSARPSAVPINSAGFCPPNAGSGRSIHRVSHSAALKPSGLPDSSIIV